MKKYILICTFVLLSWSLSGCGKKAPLSPPLSQSGKSVDYNSDFRTESAQTQNELAEEAELFPTLNKTITRSDEKKFPKASIPNRGFILDPLL